MIRLFKSQLLGYQVKSITSLSLGLISIIAVPLIANTFTIRDKIINASGFLGGLASIGYCLIINQSLRELEGKNIMINKLEKELFIDEQMSLYNQFRQQQLQPQAQEFYQDPPVVNIGNTGNGNGVNIDLPIVTDVTNNVTTTGVTSVTDDILSEAIEALTNNKSDSFIIKNILGYEGRNFNKGKEILEVIKSDIIK